MSEQNPNEQQRQERANLVNAFTRRAWQSSEQPKLAPRILAGGVALILVSGAAFGVAALMSYNHKKSAEERAKRLALTMHDRPTVLATQPGGLISPSSAATPKKTPKKIAMPKIVDTGPAAPVHRAASRVPTGPKFRTVTRLLIKNVMTGLCVDVPGYGNGGVTTPIQQFACDGSSNDNQRWDLVVNNRGAGPHGAELFTIRNSMDNYCADLPGTGRVDRATHVTENLCYPGLGDNQMWYLDKKGKNKFWIRNYVARKWCLDVLGINGAGGKDSPLTVVQCNPKDDHLWSFS